MAIGARQAGWSAEYGKLLVTYLRPERGGVVTLAALLLGSIGLQLLNPQVVKRFLDSATGGADDRTLAAAAGLFLVTALLQQGMVVGATYLSERIGWSATNTLRAELLLHCLRLDPQFHKSRTPGELIERIDGDATALANFFSRLVIQVAGNFLLLAGVLFLLWRIDWRVGLLLTIFVALFWLVIHAVQAFAASLWKAARQQSAELYGFLEERLAGTEDIRSSGAQGYTLRRLYERLGELRRAGWRARLAGRLVWTNSDLLFTLATAAVYLLAAKLFQSQVATIGTVYLISLYLGLLIRPLRQIATQAEDFQKASAGIARIRELLSQRSAIPDAGCRPLPSGPLPLAFHSVRFGYDADQAPVLDGLSFQLPPGRVLGVLGRTGSGKTTLARLLFRLFDPQSGAIALGGVDLRDTPLAELRRRVGIVTQEVQLFNASLRDNLTFFDSTLSDARILAAIETLGLSTWYESLPDGLETRLATGSGGLSAGEAQLLAFTRIFLRDPGLVILDEASSRLDPATEQRIERAVSSLLLNRTGILIAHRLQTVHHADEILILEGGVIREHGARLELMQNPDSRFARLLRTGLDEERLLAIEGTDARREARA
jgi:ABC-type multidrug transport system fused ATPase/permease subunit